MYIHHYKNANIVLTFYIYIYKWVISCIENIRMTDISVTRLIKSILCRVQSWQNSRWIKNTTVNVKKEN